MKKITITLLLFTFVLRVAGQQMNTVNMSTPKGGATPADKSIEVNGVNSNQVSNINTRSFNTSLWLNYGTAVDSLYGGSQLYSEYLWPDTDVLFNFDSAGIVVSTGEAFFYEIGNTFDLYSQTLQTGYFSEFPQPVTSSTAYSIDSMALGILYTRNDTNTSVVDTLIVYYFQAAENSKDIPVYYYPPSVNYDGDTVYVPFLQYSYTTNALTDVTAQITELKVPLTKNDTSTTNINIKEFALNTPLSVSAGNLVASAFTFKPGKAYTIGENVTDSENTLSFVSWDESPGNLPYYTPGDNNNVSSVITDSTRYNDYKNPASGYDGLFIPSFAYASTYVWDDHYIFYHVNYTTGIQTVNSVVANQTIYPNPSSDQAMIKYTLKTSASVIITVSDITGKIMGSMNEGNVSAGLNQQLLNTQNLADGIYMVSIIANGNTSVSKLVVAR